MPTATDTDKVKAFVIGFVDNLTVALDFVHVNCWRKAAILFKRIPLELIKADISDLVVI